jgi:hypothetical protein
LPRKTAHKEAAAYNGVSPRLISVRLCGLSAPGMALIWSNKKAQQFLTELC